MDIANVLIGLGALVIALGGVIYHMGFTLADLKARLNQAEKNIAQLFKFHNDNKE